MLGDTFEKVASGAKADGMEVAVHLLSCLSPLKEP